MPMLIAATFFFAIVSLLGVMECNAAILCQNHKLMNNTWG
jgi:hypothetical protein